MLFPEKLRGCGLLGMHSCDFLRSCGGLCYRRHPEMFLKKAFWKILLDAQLKNSDRVLQNFSEEVFCRTPTIRYF